MKIILIMYMLINIPKIKAEPVNKAFKDDNFYSCIIEKYNEEFKTAYDTTDSLTDEQLSKMTKLACNYDLEKLKLKDITGIEKMPNLTNLFIYNSNLEKVDLSKNIKITNLYLSNNKIKEIDISKNINLISLYISDNNLININLKNNINLENLYASNNQLTNLDITKNKKLKKIIINNNNIENIYINKNNKIEKISINNNYQNIKIGKKELIDELKQPKLYICESDNCITKKNFIIKKKHKKNKLTKPIIIVIITLIIITMYKKRNIIRRII